MILRRGDRRWRSQDLNTLFSVHTFYLALQFDLAIQTTHLQLFILLVNKLQLVMVLSDLAHTDRGLRNLVQNMRAHILNSQVVAEAML